MKTRGMSDTIIDTIRVSDKGQVVIPKEIRDRFNLRTGSRLMVIATNDAIILQKAEIVGERIRIRELVERARSLAEKLGLRRF